MLVRGSCLTKQARVQGSGAIAAANTEVEGTDVTASTLHAPLKLDAELKTELHLAKLDLAKVQALRKLQVLLLGEA